MMDRQTMQKLVTGVLAPITTPFTGGEIDVAKLALNIRDYNKTGLAGYMPLGSNGEYLGLTEKEAQRVLEVIHKEKAPGRTVVAGCGRESSMATVETIRRMNTIGLDMAFVLTPHYYASYMSEDALERYFLEIADGSPVPIVIYNAPKFAAGIKVSAELLQRLVSHENIAGMKNSSSMPIAYFREKLPKETDFILLAGNIAMLYCGLFEGAIGGVCSTATWLPDYCSYLWELIQEQNVEDAQTIYDYIAYLSERSAGKYGVAGVKYGLDLRCMQGGELRLPLLAMAEEDRQKMRVFLEKNGVRPFMCQKEEMLANAKRYVHKRQNKTEGKRVCGYP